MWQRTVLGLLTMVMSSPGASAQVICTVPGCFAPDSAAFGAVMDGATGEAIEGVRVTVIRRDVQGVTDSRGAYSFEGVGPGFDLLFEHRCYYSVYLERPRRLDVPINVGLPRRRVAGCHAKAPQDHNGSETSMAYGRVHTVSPGLSERMMLGSAATVESVPHRTGRVIDRTDGSFQLPLPEDPPQVDLLFSAVCWVGFRILEVPTDEGLVALDVGIPWQWDLTSAADYGICGQPPESA